MKTKMIVVVVLAAMCVLPLSAQVKVGVEGGMNLSHYLVSGSDGYKAEQVGGMKPGFQLGVTVDYEIGKHWMLMSVGWSLCFLRIWCWKLFFGCYSPRGG